MKQKDKRVMYHIGRRPAVPKPKMRWFEEWDAEAKDAWTGEETGEYIKTTPDQTWVRSWLDRPVKSGVFMTTNAIGIARYHGIFGNVYAYKVPEWVIKKSGGLHRYDYGNELLIPEDVWNEAEKEIEFMGKSLSRQELSKKLNVSDNWATERSRQGSMKKPGWMSDDEWENTEKNTSQNRTVRGLRATKHVKSAIKMMTSAERKDALAAFENEFQKETDAQKDILLPDRKASISKTDQEIVALLKKYMNEAVIREYICELLTEINLGQSYGTVNYTALVLDDVSHRKLAKLSPPNWKPIAHHMTIISPPNQQRRLPSHWIGAEECVKITAIAQNDQVITGLIDLGNMPLPMKGPTFPHITIATNPETGGKPMMSNEFSISDFVPVTPITICGKIEEII